jgi:glucokinase
VSDWILGFDIGGTTTTAVVGLASGEILAQEKKLSEAGRGFNAMWDLISSTGASLIDSFGQPAACSVSIGGPVDSKHGIVLSPPNLPGWQNIPLKTMLEERFGVPTVVEHDAKAGALAEWMFGSAQGADDVIFLTFGTGIGAGLVLGGRLYRGTCDGAGEVGHWRMADVGPVAYGKTGSLEALSSGAGIPLLAQDMLPERVWGTEPTAETIIELARSGDRDAAEVVDAAAKWLGRGVALLVDLLDPEIVVLGSLAVRAGSLFLPTIRRVVREESLARNESHCKIVPAGLGDRLGATAAICPVIYRNGHIQTVRHPSP